MKFAIIAIAMVALAAHLVAADADLSTVSVAAMAAAPLSPRGARRIATLEAQIRSMLLNSTAAATGGEVTTQGALTNGFLSQMDAAIANDLFWWCLMNGCSTYYIAPVLTRTIGKQPVCIQAEISKSYTDLLSDKNGMDTYKFLKMIWGMWMRIKDLTLGAMTGELEAYRDMILSAVETSATGGNGWLDLAGVDTSNLPELTILKPDAIYTCDCAALCQVMWLRKDINLATQAELKNYANCVAYGGIAPWNTLAGQQLSMNKYIGTIFNPNYLNGVKQWASTWNIKMADGTVNPILARVRTMFLAIDSNTFTDKVLATASFARCGQLSTGLWKL